MLQALEKLLIKAKNRSQYYSDNVNSINDYQTGYCDGLLEECDNTISDIEAAIALLKKNKK